MLRAPRKRPHLVFAGKPISGLYQTAQTLEAAGYKVFTVANDENFIGEFQHFECVLTPRSSDPRGLRTVFFAGRVVTTFTKALLLYDIMHAYINGGVLGRTVLAKWEFRLWKLAGKPLVLMAYGSDSLVYVDQPKSKWLTAIAQTYPHDVAEDKNIARRLNLACGQADAVIGCLIHWTGLPKLTHNPVLWYPIENFGAVIPPNTAGPIRIGHAPNHRKIKGTEAIIKAIDQLRSEGYSIDLDIIERADRARVISRLKKCDIVIDQLLMGYALSCLEGIALGKIVITGIDLTDPVYAPHYSALKDCPLIFASEATIENTLRDLCEKRAQWPKIADKIFAYGQDVHSREKTLELFEQIYERL